MTFTLHETAVLTLLCQHAPVNMLVGWWYIESFWMKLVDFYTEEAATVLPLIGLYFQRLLNDVSSAKKKPKTL